MKFAIVRPVNTGYLDSESKSIDGIPGKSVLWFNVNNGTYETTYVEQADSNYRLTWILIDGQFSIDKEWEDLDGAENSDEQQSLSKLLGANIKKLKVEFYEEQN